MERKKRKWKRDFNPRSPRGGATAANRILGHITNHFNPRSPRGGATISSHDGSIKQAISIHAPHEGERQKTRAEKDLARIISIHAPHEGERRFTLYDVAAALHISIHAPHEGERRLSECHKRLNKIISIHAPHEGERLANFNKIINMEQFQSTLPTRGSDSPTSTKSSTWSNFNPRSPRGGATQRQQRFQYQPQVFQSTLPTRGSDLFVNRRSCANAYFNPRSPRGGATTPVSTIATLAAISIHAPHEGERHGSAQTFRERSDFNPRSPRGGATFFRLYQPVEVRISIHAPHEGERLVYIVSVSSCTAFQSTLPTRGSDWTI